MIVATVGAGELRCVTQPDHAHFAAQLLGLWRLPELVGHPRRAVLLEAVREHDNGWREVDAAPRVDAASGRPHSFRDLPWEEKREIWWRGARRHAGERPYVAALVAQHALALHLAKPEGERDRDFVTAMREWRDELGERAGVDEAELVADYAWLDVADLLSLVACGAGEGEVERRRWRCRHRPGELVIDPFPMAGATTFQVPCRRIGARRFAGDADLAVSLATARWERFPVRVAPG